MVFEIGVLLILINLANQPGITTSRSEWENTYRWRLGSTPVDIKCRYCHNYIRTKVKSTPGPLGKVLKSKQISDLNKDLILSFNIIQCFMSFEFSLDAFHNILFGRVRNLKSFNLSYCNHMTQYYY